MSPSHLSTQSIDALCDNLLSAFSRSVLQGMQEFIRLVNGIFGSHAEIGAFGTQIVASKS
jgi:hypothetical protein